MVHCTHLYELNISFGYYSFYGPVPVKVIADSVIQHLRHLSIHGTIPKCALKYMVTRFPVTLETLEIDCWINTDIRDRLSMELDAAEQEPLSSLRRLGLRNDPRLFAFPSSLWRRCQSVEAVDLIPCRFGLYRLKANTMATFLESSFPNLNTINIEEIYSGIRVKDEGSARMLSTSRQGWGSVSIKGKRYPVVEESYPGEGQKIQHEVLERLARFVNLEVLWLGSNSCYYENTNSYPKKVMNHQYECLEMSLESGLDRLEGLKRLQVLNISLMATKIGQREAQWMAKHWSKLREIRGLENRGDVRKARQWFKANCPRIALPAIEAIWSFGFLFLQSLMSDSSTHGKDLLRWARVSKGWHHAVIPYIWDNLSTLTQSQYQRLTKMIIADYERVQTGGHQSSLPKYCPLIRKLGPVSDKKSISDSFLFELILDYVMVKGEPLSDTQQSTAQSIFHHFMVHCTHLYTLNCSIRHYRFHESIKVIADSAIQHLRHLSIHGSIHQRVLMYMVPRLPVTLETLELGCFIYTGSEYRLAIEIDETEQEPLSSLRRLALRTTGYSLDILPSALLRRCQSVEAVDLVAFWIGLYQEKKHTMAIFLETLFPNLNTINIENTDSRHSMKDDGSARLLSTSRLGWRSVSVKGYVEFSKQSWEALSRHSSTLESFTMVKRYYQTSVGMRPFFTSFPRLQSFVMLAETGEDYSKVKPIGANDWIHQDSLTGSLTPWPCEYTLTDLRISICGIPRPDITHDRKGRKRHPVLEETYPGESWEIQHQVYERLARFVNLETLWLGSNSCYDENPNTYSKKVMNHQYECLEMSLESGLDRLEGLKRLQVLNISLMATKIGQNEAQWMAEQWPKLHEIRGLESRVDTWRARQWFKKNCPCVATP
ncbi:MAG: hypothetical protein J3Q66DRAFT_393204, partial [Benniella sp.]